MRNSFLFVTLIAIGCSNLFAKQDAFAPYHAIVLKDDTAVHSGPGETHYATHRLQANDVVKVFRHDPGGWCAIRPPEKSFSIIPAGAVRRIADDLAEVKSSGSEAWVGTSLGPVDRPLWQVKLKQGERVVIVGETSWPHPSGKSTIWYQIKPPAGEFRWMRLRDLQLPPEEPSETPKIDYSEPPEIEPSNSDAIKPPGPARQPLSPQQADVVQEQSDRSIAVVDFEQIVDPQSNDVDAGWKSATRPIPKPIASENSLKGQFRARTSMHETDRPDHAADLRRESSQSWDDTFHDWEQGTMESGERPERFASVEPMDRQVRSFIRDRSESTPPRVRSSSLIEVENRLTSEMLKAPSQWNLADLKFEAERLQARSSDPIERMAFEHVLEKIQRCDDLRKQYQQTSLASETANRTTPAASSNLNSPSTRFDAQGVLKKLVSSSGQIEPTYVLQDDSGRARWHIAGITGMNLGQYADKRIGVKGRLGFDHKRNLDHITAERIVVIR